MAVIPTSGKKVSFFVAGDPKPTARFAVKLRRGRRRVRIERSNSGWIERCLVAAKISRPKIPLAGPLAAFVTIVLRHPSRRRDFWPIRRPDLDNYVKGPFDIFNGVVWGDDAQVVSLVMAKVYTEIPERVGMHVAVTELAVLLPEDDPVRRTEEITRQGQALSLILGGRNEASPTPDRPTPGSTPPLTRGGREMADVEPTAAGRGSPTWGKDRERGADR